MSVATTSPAHPESMSRLIQARVHSNLDEEMADFEFDLRNVVFILRFAGGHDMSSCLAPTTTQSHIAS